MCERERMQEACLFSESSLSAYNDGFQIWMVNSRHISAEKQLGELIQIIKLTPNRLVSFSFTCYFQIASLFSVSFQFIIKILGCFFSKLQ